MNALSRCLLAGAAAVLPFTAACESTGVRMHSSRLSDPEMRVVNLEYVKAVELVKTLTQFVGEDPRIKFGVYEYSNSVILEGTEERVAQVVRLIADLDVSVDLSERGNTVVVHLEHARAIDLKNVLTEFAEQDGQGLVVVADVRTNSLILDGKASVREKAMNLVATLDVKVE